MTAEPPARRPAGHRRGARHDGEPRPRLRHARARAQRLRRAHGHRPRRARRARRRARRRRGRGADRRDATSSRAPSPTSSPRWASRCPACTSTRRTPSRTAGASAPPARRSSPASWPPTACSRASSTLDGDRLLALATRMEGHPDNVAPALFGGLTIAWTDAGRPAAQEAARAPRRLAARARARAHHVDRARPQPAAGERAARGRDLQRLALHAADRGAHPVARAAARRHRGPAAPVVPGVGDAGDRPAHQAAARRTATPPSSPAPARPSSSCQRSRPSG